MRSGDLWSQSREPGLVHSGSALSANYHWLTFSEVLLCQDQIPGRYGAGQGEKLVLQRLQSRGCRISGTRDITDALASESPDRAFICQGLRGVCREGSALSALLLWDTSVQGPKVTL